MEFVLIRLSLSSKLVALQVSLRFWLTFAIEWEVDRRIVYGHFVDLRLPDYCLIDVGPVVVA